MYSLIHVHIQLALSTCNMKLVFLKNLQAFKETYSGPQSWLVIIQLKPAFQEDRIVYKELKYSGNFAVYKLYDLSHFTKMLLSQTHYLLKMGLMGSGVWCRG